MANVLDPVTNFAIATITGIDIDDVTSSVGAGEGALFPAPATAGAFNVVIFNSTDYRNPSEDPNKEILRVTARSTDALTFTRAQEGTAAATHNTGGKVYKIILAPTAKQRDDIDVGLLKLAGIEASADVTDAVNVGSSVHGSTAKTTMVDADKVAIIDTQASNVLKTLSWAYVKSILKTYFDTLYTVLTTKAAGSDITTGTDDAKFLTAKALADAAVGKIGAAWDVWTSTISASSGTITTKSGAGYWTQIGKTVHFYILITITTNGTGAGIIYFTLPKNSAARNWAGCGRESSLTGKMVVAFYGSATTGYVTYYDSTYPGGTGASIRVSGTYEAA